MIFDLIEQGDAEGLRALLEDRPEDAARKDDQGLSALMRAFYRGAELAQIVREAQPPLGPWEHLIVGDAHDLPPPDAWSPDGFTPLHLAAFAHNVPATRTLLAAGADPNVIARASFAKVTPLGTAAFAGAVDVARELLAAGADPTIPAGASPIDTARANHHTELLELLLAAR